MLKHLFKLIWKQKKSNFLMMLEIFVSFLILFAVWSLGVYYFQNYNIPAGSNTTNVWVLFCEFNSDTLREQKRELVSQKLRSYPQVESFAFSENNVPFSFSSNNSQLEYKNNEAMCEMMRVEPEMKKVLNLEMISGKWLSLADKVNKYPPLVINRAAKIKLFGDENAIGKILGEKEDEKRQVIGVVENFKYKSDYNEVTPLAMTLVSEWAKVCLIKVKPTADIDFEAKLTKELINLGSGWSMEIQHMENMKANKNKMNWIPILILIIVCGFLIFNVALGLFGVLFQTISRRKQEIGVRRAMGATQNAILWQFIGETAVIATFGVLLGIFFAVQFPLLNVFDLPASVYLMGLLLAIFSVYLIVIICAFLPSKQASKVYPAIALHEE